MVAGLSNASNHLNLGLNPQLAGGSIRTDRGEHQNNVISPKDKLHPTDQPSQRHETNEQAGGRKKADHFFLLC